MWNSHFWPFQICTSLFGKSCQKKCGTAIFGHSKFIPVFLGKVVRKNVEQPFLAIPNLYQSVWEKLSEKMWNSHFWPFQIYTSLSGKSCQKKIRLAIFGHYKFIPNFFWDKLSEKFGMAIFGHFEFILVFWEKIARKNSEWPFLAIPNLY